MRAITVWAPWGSLVAAGLKTIVTRGCETAKDLIGLRIAIHQGMRRDDRAVDAARAVGASRAAQWIMDHGDDAPQGVVLATALVTMTAWLDDTIEANLEACSRTARMYGLYLTDIRALPEPVPARGAVGIWTWEGVEHGA